MIHPAGTLILLPTTVGDPIRVLDAESLEPTDTRVQLPEGASTIDGDLSPDGSRLAVLATLSGQPVQWDTGATHVIVLDVVDGAPVADSAQVVPLIEPGEDIESPNGAAKWLRWADADTWFIESETVSTKRGQFISTEGSALFASSDIGWGWGLVPLEYGMLRVRNGGLEIVGRDGVAVDGDPAPPNDYVDRILALDGLVDVPAFEVPTMTTESLAIRPIDLIEARETSGFPDSTAPSPAEPEPALDPGVQASPAGEPEPAVASTPTTQGGRTWPWLLGAGLLAGIVLIAGIAISRRRGASSPEGQQPAIR